ncbi:MAG: phenylalanine--tRNA ligase beta subunit-related protein [Bacillus subtilis]|nr:phenylalanine--tRNA ligase beta subunit-related protein [Bacillus subtilis]
MKARLIAAGIRPISNVVDITNYVMLELGQPLHAFDLNKLSTNTIRVRDAFAGETIRTLDGQTRTLTTEDLVITNGADPVAIAGVMGGADTEVDASTTSILIESAVFNPIRVRKTSRRLDLRSESSMRFERGLDPNRTLLSADRAAMLLEELAGGISRKGVASFDINNHDENEVVVSLAKINQVLGTTLEEKEVETIFDDLGFDYKERAGVYTVFVPTRRPRCCDRSRPHRGNRPTRWIRTHSNHSPDRQYGRKINDETTTSPPPGRGARRFGIG